MKYVWLFLFVLVIAGCTTYQGAKMVDLEKYEVATFAGGCFWCMESGFQEQPGVVEVISGYTGGDEVNPTYKEISTGRTGHKEAVQVYYDPKNITYEELLELFWAQIDPTDEGGQFADRGPQYKTAIFYHNENEKKLAEKSKQNLSNSGMFEEPIVTEILSAKEFYKAEENHQDYYLKQSVQYKLYEKGSGRKGFIERVWGNVKKTNQNNEENLKEKLTDMQYKVTQEGGTEPAFDNEYWDKKEEGIYVDVVSGEPLFSSKDKFDSGTGWPSFTRPIDEALIEREKDLSYGMVRTEIKSTSGSHLGHVFDDGPDGEPRFCVNSASLRFVSKENLEEEGYGEYSKLFQ